eukprot:468795-Pyramimonas_sp.AAC.1
MGGDLLFHAPDLARFSLQIGHANLELGLSEGLLDIRFPSGPTCRKVNAQIHGAIAQGSRAVTGEKLQLPGHRSVRADK